MHFDILCRTQRSVSMTTVTKLWVAQDNESGFGHGRDRYQQACIRIQTEEHVPKGPSRHTVPYGRRKARTRIQQTKNAVKYFHCYWASILG
jgi:hypothetical protein